MLSLNGSRGNLLGCTGGDNPIYDAPFDQPVILIWTADSILHALKTQVVITIFTDATVVMFVGNGPTAVIAVNAIDPRKGLVGGNGKVQTVLA